MSNVTISLTPLLCGKCGLVFCVPCGYASSRVLDGGTVFCPAGHPIRFDDPGKAPTPSGPAPQFVFEAGDEAPIPLPYVDVSGKPRKADGLRILSLNQAAERYRLSPAQLVERWSKAWGGTLATPPVPAGVDVGPLVGRTVAAPLTIAPDVIGEDWSSQCPCCNRVFTDRGKLRTHLVQQHALPMSEVDAAFSRGWELQTA